MIKLGYKGKLSEDIINANKTYDFVGSNIIMFIMDILLSLGMLILGFKFNREDINNYLVSVITFGTVFSITLFKAFTQNRKVQIEKNKSILKLSKFSKYLRKNKIDISERDLVNAIISKDKVVNYDGKVLDNVVSYQINSKDKKRLLVEMRDILAQNIYSFKVRANLVETEEKINISEDLILYLVEDYELSKGENSKKKALISKKF